MRQQRGFSLVELSIVLVILGLLVGGILAGRSLVRASELRAVTSEYSKYQTAFAAFKDKYFNIPGDMNNATSFWGAAHATPATCVTTQGTGTQTCDGDGNGSVSDISFSVGNRYELYRLWQHLANAGLIEGSYTGIGANGNNAVIGTNVPASKLKGGGWSFYAFGNYGGDTFFFAANYGNAMYFGGQSSDPLTGGVILKAEEMWNIDSKLDDGLPHIGRIVAQKNSLRPNCTASSNVAYNLSATAIDCVMLFTEALKR